LRCWSVVGHRNVIDFLVQVYSRGEVR